MSLRSDDVFLTGRYAPAATLPAIVLWTEVSSAGRWGPASSDPLCRHPAPAGPTCVEQTRGYLPGGERGNPTKIPGARLRGTLPEAATWLPISGCLSESPHRSRSSTHALPTASPRASDRSLGLQCPHITEGVGGDIQGNEGLAGPGRMEAGLPFRTQPDVPVVQTAPQFSKCGPPRPAAPATGGEAGSLG